MKAIAGTFIQSLSRNLFESLKISFIYCSATRAGTEEFNIFQRKNIRESKGIKRRYQLINRQDFYQACIRETVILITSLISDF